ncbi:MAG: hypothetical protein KBT01_09445 [Clostridiales bacterium]|nr:hypothetical protein [Candidatus Blautia equi]
MLKALIKKQFKECFRSYYVNGKKNKSRSKAGIIGMYVLFTLLMLFLVAAFFGLSFLMGDPLFEAGYPEMFFAVISIISIALGVFGSVFNTYSALYMAKDNEQLLSMPIPPSVILISRIALVFGLSLLYSGIVWIPAMAYVLIFQKLPALAVVFGILLTFIITLFVTVLTCALGWIVALIASRMKNRSFLVVILTLAFLGAYYYVCFNMSTFLEGFVVNIRQILDAFKKWLGLFYQIGLAAMGDVRAMLFFTGLTAVTIVACLVILTKTFNMIVTRAPETARNKGPVKDGIARSYKTALFMKELKHFTSSPTYMLNAGLGIALLPAIAIFALYKQELIRDAVTTAFIFLPQVKQFFPAIVFIMVSMIGWLDAVSTPSVSLEGKTLWISHVLPVSGKDVLRAKLKLHVVLNLPSAIFGAVSLGYVFKMSAMDILVVTLYSCLFIWFSGAFGLVIGVLRPNFTWTSETMPIKSSLNLVIAWLGTLLVMAILLGSYYFFWEKYSVMVHLEITAVITAVLSILLTRWLDTKGAARFESL